MKFDKEEMRARFHEAQAEKVSIQAKSAPLREQREEIAKQVNALEAQKRPLTEQIKEIESGLYDLDNEIAFLARGLGNVGEPPKSEAAE